jgi:hypothetical protein
VLPAGSAAALPGDLPPPAPLPACPGAGILFSLARQQGSCGYAKTLENKPFRNNARVAELADAQDLGSCPERGAGSIPAPRIYCETRG